MISASLTKYVITAAFRDRLLVSMLVIFAIAISLSTFFGSAAINEKKEFTAVFAAGSIRMLNIFGLCLFVVFFIRRSFEAREIEYMLTRPIGRIKFLLSYAIGFSIIAVFFGLISGLCIYLLEPKSFSSGHIMWMFSICVENIIMVNAALFFAMILSSAATASFTVLGFYAVSRMMAELLGIIDASKQLTKSEGLEMIVQFVSFFMPRLDMMGQTSWLLYGPSDQISYGFLFLQGAIYSALLLCAAMIDLVLRKF